jgi:hypothetical protein
MHRELEWPVSKETCLYTHLYMVYIHLYKIIEGTRCTQEGHFISLRRPYLVSSCPVMGAFNVLTGAVYLLASSLSRTGHHPETDSLGAVHLLYIISIKYRAWFRRKTLIWSTWARNTTHKNTENNGAGLSYSGKNGRKLT